MNHASYRIQRWIKSIGMPGILAVALLVFCLAFYLSALIPGQTRIAQLEDEARLLSRQMSSSRPDLEPTGEPPAAQLARFFGYFPEPGTVPDWLDRIHNAARRENLALDRGEYKPVRDSGEQLQRYVITLPVRGTYPGVRRFLAAVLQEIPYMALDGVSFERQNVGDANVEARVRMTLYLEPTL